MGVTRHSLLLSSRGICCPHSSRLPQAPEVAWWWVSGCVEVVIQTPWATDGPFIKTRAAPGTTLEWARRGVALHGHPHLHGTHRRPVAVDPPPPAGALPHRLGGSHPCSCNPRARLLHGWPPEEGGGDRRCADLRMVTPRLSFRDNMRRCKLRQEAVQIEIREAVQIEMRDGS